MTPMQGQPHGTNAWDLLDQAAAPIVDAHLAAIAVNIPSAEIERYADQLRRDAETAEDGVAVGLLRAADGLGDLLVEMKP